MQDSHGRCMFTGCGDRLDIEQLTGMKGNIGYLAHNVASSERGEREFRTFPTCFLMTRQMYSFCVINITG